MEKGQRPTCFSQELLLSRVFHGFVRFSTLRVLRRTRMGIQVVPAPRDELRAGWVCEAGAPPWWPFLPSARQEGFVPVVATWVGSPELPVPAHGHHDQQVAQDGHQDDGGDEGEQHDLLRDAEALTRTGSAQGDERERRRSCSGSGRGTGRGGPAVPATGTGGGGSSPRACRCGPLPRTISIHGHSHPSHPAAPPSCPGQDEPPHTLQEPIQESWSEPGLIPGSPAQSLCTKTFPSSFCPNK